MFSKAATIIRGVLVLVGMVLAAPLGAQERCVDSLGPTLKLAEAKGGGLLLKTGQPGLYVRAPELEARVHITVRGVVARTRVLQRFTNPSDEWVEAVYVFPLPEGCAVDTLRMKVGERIIEGQIKERGEAKRICVKAKKAGQRAALLEQERPNMFTISVANIGPREHIEITIEYQQLLIPEDGRFELPSGEVFRYTVAEAFVLDEDDVEIMGESPGRRLTLLTCYPFDALVPGGPGRFAVVGTSGEVP